MKNPGKPQVNSDFTATSSAALHTTADIEHTRINLGLLAKAERKALRWLVIRVPDSVHPDHLTLLGVLGAILTMIGLIAMNIAYSFVVFAILGLLLNWLGDSLDGTLARYRQIERPHIGYFIDHSCDLISQVFIFAGLGLSPHFTIFSAVLALSMYMLMSSYTYLKVMVIKEHNLSYGGMGATELRLGIACWALLEIAIGHQLVDTKFMKYALLDEVISIMWVAIFLCFVWMVKVDLAKAKTLFDKDPGTDFDNLGSRFKP